MGYCAETVVECPSLLSLPMLCSPKISSERGGPASTMTINHGLLLQQQQYGTILWHHPTGHLHSLPSLFWSNDPPLHSVPLMLQHGNFSFLPKKPCLLHLSHGVCFRAKSGYVALIKATEKHRKGIHKHSNCMLTPQCSQYYLMRTGREYMKRRSCNTFLHGNL